MSDRPINAAVEQGYVLLELGDLLLTLSETEVQRLAFLLESCLQDMAERK